MERGNTKHGPAHDQQMAHEAEGMVHGGAHRAHAEEWREPEPVDDAIAPVRRGDGANPRPSGRDYELRTELARLLTNDVFPTGRDQVVDVLRDRDAPGDLIGRVQALPADSRFERPRDVIAALGINDMESHGGTDHGGSDPAGRSGA